MMNEWGELLKGYCLDQQWQEMERRAWMEKFGCQEANWLRFPGCCILVTPVECGANMVLSQWGE